VAWYGHSDALAALKEAGTNVLVEDKEGLTATFHAAKHGYLSMVNALIDSTSARIFRFKILQEVRRSLWPVFAGI
jgi:ankyrin repeat protein